MSKLLNFLLAGTLVLTVGFAVAQNKPADPAQSGATNTPPAVSEEGSAGKQAEGDATKAPQAKSEEGSAAKQAESGATASPSEEYTAALKKCDPLTGTDKSQCVDAAKKKHGQI